MDGAVEDRDSPADGSRCLWVGVVPALKYLSPASSGQDVRLMVGSVRAFGLALLCPALPALAFIISDLYIPAPKAWKTCAPPWAHSDFFLLSPLARTVGFYARVDLN
jgi:hypothetical protein